MENKISVSLFGTCADSKWRERLIPLLSDDIDWFNPVVEDWNEEAQKNELRHRAEDDYMLYVFTPLMSGVYAIAEVVDDSHKREGTVVFCMLEEDNGVTWEPAMLKSMRAVEKLLKRNGVTICHSLQEVADNFNALAEISKG